MGFPKPQNRIKTDSSAAECIVSDTVRQKNPKAMDMKLNWIKDWIKQKYLFMYSEPVIQNMGDYIIKHYPPHHHKEIRSTYLYMSNSILNINHTVLQGWSNDVLKINHTVVQGCVDVIHTDGHTNIPTVTQTGDWTKGTAHGRMSQNTYCMAV